MTIGTVAGIIAILLAGGLAALVFYSACAVSGRVSRARGGVTEHYGAEQEDRQ